MSSPGPLIAVLGGGQLGRMLALAGYPLGLRFRFLDPNPDAPAGDVGDLVVGEFDDPAALDELTAGATLVTYEFENVPLDAAAALSRRLPVYPPPAALEVSQDRLHEKRLFEALGIPTAAFAQVDTEEDLHEAVGEQGIRLPAVLKTRRFGYDGKGQAVLRSPEDVQAAWRALGDMPLILESFVPFQREVSILAVRSTRGEVAFYPLVENVHADGILRESIAPAPPPPPLRAPHRPSTAAIELMARAAAQRVLERLDYVGVLAIEFFQVGGGGGGLVANEMAPRVHNSGHWTIEGAQTSQFQNHLRAVLGLPLGPTAPVGCSTMFNLIGSHPPVGDLTAFPGAHLHLYGKQPRSGRKIGHITVREESGDYSRLNALAEPVRSLLQRRGWNGPAG